MGNSSLFDGRRKYFGREDYWYSYIVGDYGSVHNTHHIPVCNAVAESQEILEGNLNNYITL